MSKYYTTYTFIDVTDAEDMRNNGHVLLIQSSDLDALFKKIEDLEDRVSSLEKEK